MIPTMARALSVAVVILLGLFGAVQDATEFSLPWNTYSTFGFSSSIDGRITGVQAGSPAAKAGLKDGDRIDVTPLGLHERRRLIYKTMAPPNGRITFSVIAGGKRRDVSLVSTPYERNLLDNIGNTIDTVEHAAFLVIAAILVLLRPSLLTWSFFLIALSVQPGAWTQAFLSDRLIVPYTFLANASIIAGAAASVIFAMLFPRTTPSPAIRRTAGALALFGIALLIFDTANGYSLVLAWITHGSAARAALVFALAHWANGWRSVSQWGTAVLSCPRCLAASSA
jgi:hypothetical protein